MDLNTPIEKLGGIYKKYVGRLEKIGIKKLEDFLYHIPFRYEDFSIISKIEQIQPGETVTVQGKIVEIKNEYTRRWRNIQKAKIQDNTGQIDAIWFNQPFIPRIIQINDTVSLSGKIRFSLGKKVMESPEYEVLNGKTLHTGRLVPIYNETRGVSSRWIRKQVDKILRENLKELKEHFPKDILRKNNLIDLRTAIKNVHFPNSLSEVREARERLSFDELFFLQLIGIVKREDWKKKSPVSVFQIYKFKDRIEKFLEKLPFELTNSQKKAVEEILKDLQSKKPMNRLLEGDVGSGKTVVAAIAMYIAYLNGFQSVFMAPTEILSSQHFKTINDLLAPFGIKVAMTTSNLKKNLDNFDVLVGTHAVLSGRINFKKLGFIVIDEQQRFGVRQRSQLRNKGNSPHLLTMTATPIPRTVALTLYGDLDVTFLSEMPHGRKIVKTWHVPEEKRQNAYSWIEKELKSNKTQAFIICPFIEESETMTTVKAATKEFERLKKHVFPNLKLELLHGKLKSKEKDKILDGFKKRKVDILVATPVVEVGIDIPNATVMLIETSGRFGLSQLHQLRGRVGRSDKQSYCLLFTDSKNEKTLKRLKSMESIHVGAVLAELDLKLRGPGEMYGTSQHGMPMLKIASFSDFSLIEKTRKEAEIILPDLKKYPVLLNKIKLKNLTEVSPD